MYWRAFEKTTTSTASSAGLPADRALPPAQPVRPPARPARARAARGGASSASWRICLAQALRSRRATSARPAPSWSGCWRPTRATPRCSSSSRSLAESEGDLAAAAKYQKQAHRARPQRRGPPGWRSSTSARRHRARPRPIWSRLAPTEQDASPHPPGDRQPARPAASTTPCWPSPGGCSARTRATGRRSTARAAPCRPSTALPRRPTQLPGDPRPPPAATTKRGPTRQGAGGRTPTAVRSAGTPAGACAGGRRAGSPSGSHAGAPAESE